MSCHTPGGQATAEPFNDAMQAVPGVEGTSHRWDGVMPDVSDPMNRYGLRRPAVDGVPWDGAAYKYALLNPS